MNKKYKVTFLLDDNNLWIEKYLRESKINKKNNQVIEILIEEEMLWIVN